MKIRSQELADTIRDINTNQETGTLKVQINDSFQKANGTLKFDQGTIIKVDYLGLNGQAALQELSNSEPSKISFKASNRRSNKKTSTKGKQNKQRVGFGIFQQIFLVVLFVSFIPLFGLFYNNWQAQESLQANASTQLQLASQAVEKDLERWINSNILSVQQNALSPAITSLDPTLQTPILNTIHKTYPWNFDAWFTNLDGYISSYSDDIPLQNEDGSYVIYGGDLPFVRDVFNGSDLGISLIDDPISGNIQVCFAAPVLSNNELGGVFGTCSNIDQISEAVVSGKVGNTGYAMLVDTDNRLVANGLQSMNVSEFTDMTANPVLQQGTLNEVTTINHKGDEVIAYVTETSLGWKLIVQQDSKEALAQSIKARNNAYILLLITLLLVVIFAYLLSKRFSKPILNLTNVAEGISVGQLNEVILETNRKDEIGVLAQSIERLRQSVKVAMVELNRQQTNV